MNLGINTSEKNFGEKLDETSEKSLLEVVDENPGATTEEMMKVTGLTR